jgi:hypothetical protein
MSKDEKRIRIMDGFKVKHDCFAYDRERHMCNALEYLVCKTEKCPFYKTAYERCEVCKATRVYITCSECKKNGLE